MAHHCGCPSESLDYLRPPSAAARPGLSNVRVLGRLAFTRVFPISGSSPSTNSTSTRSQRKRRHQANSPSSNSSGCSITSVMTHPGKISTLNPTQTSSGQFTHHPARPPKSPAAFHPVPRNPRPAKSNSKLAKSMSASVPPHLMTPNQASHSQSSRSHRRRNHCKGTRRATHPPHHKKSIQEHKPLLDHKPPTGAPTVPNAAAASS